MKNKINILLLGGMLLGAVSFTSCNDDDSWTPGDIPEGPQVYFPNTINTDITATKGVASYSIDIFRIDTSEDVTIPVTATPADGDVVASAFSFPANVSFPKGQKQVSYTFTCDGDQLTGDIYDIPQEFVLSLPDDYVSPFGSGSVLISVTLPSAWTLLGTGFFYDIFWFINDDDYGKDIEIWQNEKNTNLYRFENPYEFYDGQDQYFTIQVFPEGGTYMGQTIEPDFVAYNSIIMDYYFDADDEIDEPLYLLFPGALYKNRDDWGNNYVASYQSDGVTPAEIYLEPLYALLEFGYVWEPFYDYGAEEYVGIFFPDESDVASIAKVKANKQVFTEKVNIRPANKVVKK